MGSPWYCSRDALLSAISLSSPSTGDILQAELTLESVSRQIEMETGHKFQPEILTQRFTANESRHCYVDDLLSVTTFAIDTSGGRNYNTILSATCYELSPFNAPNEHPPHPYWEVMILPNSSAVFPSYKQAGGIITGSFEVYRNAVQITGSYGFYDVEKTVTAATTSIDATSTSFTLPSTAAIQVGNTIKVDSEQMFVNSFSSAGAIGVDRGVNGTSGAAHASAAVVNVYQYPIVERACQIQAARILERRHSAFGVVGTADVGQIRLTAALDPDVKRLLGPLTLPTMA